MSKDQIRDGVQVLLDLVQEVAEGDAQRAVGIFLLAAAMMASFVGFDRASFLIAAAAAYDRAEQLRQENAQ